MIALDSVVISYIYNMDTRAAYYLDRIEGLRAFISFQTLEESWRGAYFRGWGDRQKGDLQRYLDQYEVIWPSLGLVDQCARLRSERERAGRSLSPADAWIAAAALYLGCPLASHDRGFRGIPNLELIQAP